MLKEEHEGTGGNRTAALLRGIFNPRVRLEKMKNEGRDFGEMHAPWEKAGADLRSGPNDNYDAICGSTSTVIS